MISSVALKLSKLKIAKRWLSTTTTTTTTATTTTVVEPPTIPPPSTPSLPLSKTPKVRSPKLIHHHPTPPLSAHVPIPPKHHIHVATLHLRAHTTSLASLTFFTSFALRAARALALPTSNVISLPTKTSLYTVPRSPFAHKKSQENFWKKEHKRAIKVYDADSQMVRAWLAYLRKEALGGVGMKAQLIEYREAGWGREMGKGEAELLKGHTSERDEARESIEALSAELVQELESGIEASEGIASELKEEAEMEMREAVQEVVEVENQIDAEQVVEEKVEASPKEAEETPVEEKVDQVKEEPKSVEKKE